MTHWAEGEFKSVIEDARARQAAIVGLIHAADNQALALLRIYATLATATGAGFIAALLTDHTWVAFPGAMSMAVATASWAAGAGCCISVIQSSKIALPGRGGGFWLWALERDDRIHVMKAYLSELEGRQRLNMDINQRLAKRLKAAKRCGAAAPIVTLLVFGAAYVSQL